MSMSSISHPTAVFALDLGTKVFTSVRGVHEIPGVEMCWAIAFLKAWSENQENMCKSLV